jgi:hypothetical protein
MADLTPNNREEYWLKGMVDGQTTLEPNKRREYWYKEIVDAIGSGGGGGTGGGALVLNITQDDTLDKTWLEIKNALNAGQVVTIANYALSPNAGMFAHIVYAKVEDGVYKVVIQEYIEPASDNVWQISAIEASTDSENGYPAL